MTSPEKSAEQFVIVTPRLQLGLVEPSLAHATSALVTEDVAAGLISWTFPMSPADVRARIRKAQRATRAGRAITWAIAERREGMLIGWLLVCRKSRREGEIGYWLGRQYRGQGYMREALVHALPVGRTFLNVDTFRALVFPENHRSIAVLEVVGFRRCGEKVVRSPVTKAMVRVVNYALELGREAGARSNKERFA